MYHVIRQALPHAYCTRPKLIIMYHVILIWLVINLALEAWHVLVNMLVIDLQQLVDLIGQFKLVKVQYYT